MHRLDNIFYWLENPKDSFSPEEADMEMKILIQIYSSYICQDEPTEQFFAYIVFTLMEHWEMTLSHYFQMQNLMFLECLKNAPLAFCKCRKIWRHQSNYTSQLQQSPRWTPIFMAFVNPKSEASDIPTLDYGRQQFSKARLVHIPYMPKADISFLRLD